MSNCFEHGLKIEMEEILKRKEKLSKASSLTDFKSFTMMNCLLILYQSMKEENKKLHDGLDSINFRAMKLRELKFYLLQLTLFVIKFSLRTSEENFSNFEPGMLFDTYKRGNG